MWSLTLWYRRCDVINYYLSSLRNRRGLHIERCRCNNFQILRRLTLFILTSAISVIISKRQFLINWLIDFIIKHLKFILIEISYTIISINLVNQNASIYYIDSSNTLNRIRQSICDSRLYLEFRVFAIFRDLHLLSASTLNLSSTSKLRSCITRTRDFFNILTFCRVSRFIKMILFDIIISDFISYFMLHR